MSITRLIYLIEAAVMLALARFFVLCVPVLRLGRILGPVNMETPHVECPFPGKAALVAWAVQKASMHTPWRSKCLEQAIAGKMMLRRRRIRSTLYLGVRREHHRLEAHAWLRCGLRDVTGGSGKKRFAVVAFFGEKE